MKWAAIFSIAYVVARLLYMFAYLGNVPTLRSAVWTVGFSASVGLMVLPIVS